MNDTLRLRVAELRQRAAAPGLAPVQWAATAGLSPTSSPWAEHALLAGWAVDGIRDFADGAGASVPVGRLGVTALQAVSDFRAGVAAGEIAATLRQEVGAQIAINGAGVAVEMAPLGFVPRQLATPVIRVGTDRRKAQRSATEALTAQRAALAHLRDQATSCNRLAAASESGAVRSDHS